MEKYSSTILIKNIDTLCKNHNMRISDLEKECEMSAGYISRIKKSNKSMSINLLINICNVFSVSIEDILFTEIPRKLTPTEELLNEAHDLLESVYIDINEINCNVKRKDIDKVLDKLEQLQSHLS